MDFIHVLPCSARLVQLKDSGYLTFHHEGEARKHVSMLASVNTCHLFNQCGSRICRPGIDWIKSPFATSETGNRIIMSTKEFDSNV